MVSELRKANDIQRKTPKGATEGKTKIRRNTRGKKKNIMAAEAQPQQSIRPG
jgi:hypothetical protein